MSILVTGGAGYIGSHVVRLLTRGGHDVVVVDSDTRDEAAERVAPAALVTMDLAADGAQARLEQVLETHGVEAVVHFAAEKQVGVSMEQPVHYYRQNVGGLVNLLAAMQARRVTRLVFSSSAAAYGVPESGLVSEDAEARPINPYGETKLIGEWLLADSARAWGLSATSLRYFNVAGAGWDDLGDPAALNLIPIVFERLDSGRAPAVFGTDYPTPDGTCIRDYVHVLDLADAHLTALEHVKADGAGHEVFNIGTGRGFSVLEVLAEIARASGTDIRPDLLPRRAGDPPELTADPARAEAVLGWKARHGLAEIVDSAWSAHRARATARS